MRRWITLALALLLPAQALGWGFDGHRRLAKLLPEPLPPQSCLRQWLQANQSASFLNASADPDRWRIEGTPGYDPDEWPRHFLQIDHAQPVTRYPREWPEVQTQFGFYAEKNGRVPWRVEEYYGRLVTAFASQQSSHILTTLAHFSHYVTDAFSVLHNTRNFDPNGLHQRWETEMLDAASRIDALSTQAAQYYGTVGRADPRHRTFDVVIVGNGLVNQLIAADLDTPNDMNAFFTAVRDLTARRWGDALTLQASLVASAWVDAGSPALPGMLNNCSKAVPQGELALKGYALPPPPPDAGLPSDAGASSEDGGNPVEGSGPIYIYVPPPPPPEPGCGCSHHGPLASVSWWLLALWLGRRRR